MMRRHNDAFRQLLRTALELAVAIVFLLALLAGGLVTFVAIEPV